MINTSKFLAGLSGIHDKIVKDVPKLQRGMVWCKICKRSQKVDSAECLRSGWPECHGEIMTIDPPEEWEKKE